MRGTPVRFVDFRGGLNTQASPYLVAENQCRDCLNVVSTFRGSIKKRNGNVVLARSLPGFPTKITSLFGLNQGATVLIAAGGTKVYSITSAGVVQDITGGLSFSENKRWEFISAPVSGGQGPLYAVNGIDNPQYWTGTGSLHNWTASVGTVPNGKFITTAANRVWIAGTTANPSRVYFSDLGDPRSWTATNTVDFDPFDGQQITGIYRFGALLFVFKQSKVFVIYDLDTGANRAVSTTVGCVAPRSIAEGPNGLFFLSDDQGVFIVNQSSLKRISDNITPFFLDIANDQKPLAAGEFFNDHYYLSCAYEIGSDNTMTLDWDSITESWWKHSNGVNDYALWRESLTDELRMFAADGITPVVEELYVRNIFQDDGINYEAKWLGPWLTFKAPYLRKRLRQIHVDGHGHVNVYVGKDFLKYMNLWRTDIFFSGVMSYSKFGDSSHFGQEGVFGDIVDQAEGRIYSLGVSRAWSVEFENFDKNDIEIDAYTMMITPRKN